MKRNPIARVIILTRFAILCIIVHCSRISADEPWLVVLEGQHLRANRLHAKHAIEIRASADDLPTAAKSRLEHLLKELEQPWYFDLAHKSNRSTMSGWVYPGVNPGWTNRIRFWRSSQQTQVDELMTIILAERQGNLQLTEVQNGYLLKSSPQSDPENRRRTSWVDAYVTTQKDLMFLASSIVSDEFGRELQKLLPDANDYAYYSCIAPGAIPAQERTALFEAISVVAESRLQLRDDEDVLEHAVRSARGKLVLEAIRAALFDVERGKFWTQWIGAGSPDRCEFGGMVVAKEGTGLATFFQSICGDRISLGPSLNDDVFASCEINLDCSLLFAANGDSVVRFLADRYPQHKSALGDIKDAKMVNSLLQLSDGPFGDTVLSGILASPAAFQGFLGSDEDQSSISNVAVQHQSNTSRQPLAFAFGGVEYQPVLIHSSGDDRVIRFECAVNDGTLTKSPVMAFSETDPSVSILSVKMNLLPDDVEAKEQPARLHKRLKFVEKLIYEWMVEWNFWQLLRGEKRRPVPRLANEFVPLSTHVSAAGQWDFELHVFVSGPALIVRGSLGREFHDAILSQVIFSNSVLHDVRVLRRAFFHR